MLYNTSSHFPRFDQRSGALLLDIDKKLTQLDEGLKRRLVAEGFEFKDEFHITIFGFKQGKTILEILNSLSSPDMEKLIEAMKKLIMQTDWTIETTSNELYKISKNYNFRDAKGNPKTSKREAVIQILKFNGLEGFVTAFSDITRRQFYPQFIHLTFFTKGDDESSRMGIGIDTKEDFQKLDPKSVEL